MHQQSYCDRSPPLSSLQWLHLRRSGQRIKTIYYCAPAVGVTASMQASPVCLISSMQPFGVQGMKQSPRSPRDSFPALMLVSLETMKIRQTKKLKANFLLAYQKQSLTVNPPTIKFRSYPSTSFSGATAFVTFSVLILWIESKGSCTMRPWTEEFSFTSLIL